MKIRDLNVNDKFAFVTGTGLKLYFSVAKKDEENIYILPITGLDTILRLPLFDLRLDCEVISDEEFFLRKMEQ